MRYYLIEIYDEEMADDEGNIPVMRRYSSHRNDVYNPGGLQIEMDISRFNFDSPMQDSRVSIWGISPIDMQQDMVDLVGKSIRVYAGMLNGLPLSAHGTTGLVVQGSIMQVIGNWQGVDLRQDLILTSQPLKKDAVSVSTLAAVNLTLAWNAGVKLSVALTQCFQILGGYKFEINIDDRLVSAHDQAMFCGSLEELAKALYRISVNIIKDPGYVGVKFAFREDTIVVYDSVNTSTSTSASGEAGTVVTDLQFIQLIGQPTWIKYGVMSLVCVMRNDLAVGSIIKLPRESRPVSVAGSISQYRSRTAFSGDFMVQKVRFIGNSRTPDATGWVTIIEAGVMGDITN